MGKVTFVVDFEDGKEPEVSVATSLFGGKLVAVAWSDLINDQAVPVMPDNLPAPNQTVLLFDANGEGWLIGWRTAWMGIGQIETGEWDWSFQIDGITGENITHWAWMPDNPETALEDSNHD